MKRSLFIVNLMIVLSITLACKNTDQPQAKAQSVTAEVAPIETQKTVIAVISPEELEQKMTTEDIQLIDVRTDREWLQGHLVGAQHFEINNAAWETQIGTLDKNKPVYVYCAMGGRSARSAKQLEKAGFIEIYDLKGGITDWKSQGKPVE